MNRWDCALLVVFGTGLRLAAQDLSPEEKKEGFVALFNGKDFSGWRFGARSALGAIPKNWSAGNGLITLHGGGNPHLASQWDYDDFDMRFQWKAHKKGYNSGFYVRSGRELGANQINLAQSAAGNLMGGIKGGPAVPKLQKEPGEWNEWRVLAVGAKLTFWCNGAQAWEVTGFKPARGYLGFQAEGAAIDFKNLRIKEIGFQDLTEPEHWETVTKDRKISAKSLGDGLIRLEWKGSQDATGAIQLRGGKVSFSQEDIRKTANPPDQWNYLEIKAQGNKASLWHNGQTLKGTVGLPEVQPGPIVLEIGPGEVEIRRLRIREGSGHK